MKDIGKKSYTQKQLKTKKKLNQRKENQLTDREMFPSVSDKLKKWNNEALGFLVARNFGSNLAREDFVDSLGRL